MELFYGIWTNITFALQFGRSLYVNTKRFTFSGDQHYYSFEQLDYIYFVHSLCLLGRLLLYKDSRELFPVVLPSTDGMLHYTVFSDCADKFPFPPKFKRRLMSNSSPMELWGWIWDAWKNSEHYNIIKTAIYKTFIFDFVRYCDNHRPCRCIHWNNVCKLSKF